jgi:hypothetical protein
MLKAHAEPVLPPVLRDVALMNYEWKGWQDVVSEFRKLGLEIDDPKFDKLIASINVWGEKLHRLRREQPEKTVEKALLDYEKKYAE